ncbi:MAG TPA: phage holin family protein [Actinomycetes bacterium]
MTATAPPPGSSEETLGALIATASRDLSTLVRSEIELAKAEIRADAKNGIAGAAMFGAAAFLVVLAVILLSVAAAYGLVALGLHSALAFLAVAGFYLLLAVVLALVGKTAIGKVGPPQRTIRTSKETASFLKKPRSTDAQTPTA